jgi:hypothetical protein
MTLITKQQTEQLLANGIFNFAALILTDEYRDAGVAHCILDAVFSIGVKYGSTPVWRSSATATKKRSLTSVRPNRCRRRQLRNPYLFSSRTANRWDLMPLLIELSRTDNDPRRETGFSRPTPHCNSPRSCARSMSNPFSNSNLSLTAKILITACAPSPECAVE